ncbi:MAG: metal-dependent transcriptional regulator [Coraliomargaritaceae bacterium]
MASATVEDYIKHIFVLSEGEELAEVSMGRVADALGVVPGTATTMVKALADAGLVQYAPRIGVSLTVPGRRLALHVLRRHRLIEQFLVEVLGYDWSEVHEEAEHLEHVISDRLLERMDRYLGFPTEDPHGDPIPTAEGDLKASLLERLSNCVAGGSYRVARISDQDANFLQYIAEAGLHPGASISVERKDEDADSITLRIGADGAKRTLGLSAASKVLVCKTQ